MLRKNRVKLEVSEFDLVQSFSDFMSRGNKMEKMNQTNFLHQGNVVINNGFTYFIPQWKVD